MRLVNGAFSGRTGPRVTRDRVSRKWRSMWPGRGRGQIPHHKASVFMSAQRMTLELRKSGADFARLWRPLRLAGALMLFAVPLGGCGTGSLWDKFMAKDDTFIEEPPDKLYNEGLYLMNQRKDAKAASKKFEEV